MTDRKLLEAAAKAAELDFDHSRRDRPLILVGSRQEDWNPLTDDGDALRLAVKLRMTVDCEDAPDEADRNAAVRRAIVLAAANMTPNVADERRAVGTSAPLQGYAAPGSAQQEIDDELARTDDELAVPRR